DGMESVVCDQPGVPGGSDCVANAHAAGRLADARAGTAADHHRPAADSGARAWAKYVFVAAATVPGGDILARGPDDPRGHRLRAAVLQAAARRHSRGRDGGPPRLQAARRL